MPYCEKYHNMKGLDCQPIILLIFVIKIACRENVVGCPHSQSTLRVGQSAIEQ